MQQTFVLQTKVQSELFINFLINFAMSRKIKTFTSRLEASSYHAPGGGAAYQPLRESLIKKILEQGYDEETMIEHVSNRFFEH